MSDHRQPTADPATGMHDHSPELLALVDNVIDYSRRRLIFDDVPLDKPMPERELRRLAPGSITEEGIGSRRALAMFENVLAPACVSIDHPGYVAFIPSAPTKASVAFDLVVSASSVYGGSWLEGSGAIFAENEVLRMLANEFGMPESAGGVFVQGGTVGNLSALVTARDARRRALEAAGRDRPDRWIVICSEESHSSVRSAAEVMDVRVVTAEADASGRLHGDAVRPLLEEHGDAVFAVVGTAGSTNLGLVDGLASIAALKDEFDFWFHVDGAYGLAAALLPELRECFAGVEAADSVIVDPHKWLFAPFDACALIYRDPVAGRLAHTQKAGYLDTLEGDDWNPSDFAVQLTRRARGLPLWYSIATHGVGAYREAIRHGVTVAHAVADLIRARPELELVTEPELSVVAFRRVGWDASDYDRWSAQLLDDQLAFVTASSHRGQPITRFAVINPRTTVELLSEILDTMK
ncbi:aspartate aminotransferase family protein [Gulosibacter macacae]|uniref:Aspartate aminotransferase family protein n=1 Tax=Gulosibacter macacae TaxID=2488791 RepID=A0A3P3VV81_9MICO|nr:pyridoxal-dependent decarboxylase [Gulosibacter macacae]RRJ86725.1 aspartate aminotransferase family protein [Gulosibacter macacae]